MPDVVLAESIIIIIKTKTIDLFFVTAVERRKEGGGGIVNCFCKK